MSTYQAKIKQKSSLAAIFLTFAVDQLGATIVFPIFAPLFLSPTRSLFTSEVSPGYKTMMLGIFLGIFPLMQFLFAPLLGEYADHHGRRKTLLFTIFLTSLGYALCGAGIHYHWLFSIFSGRLIMGVGAGNLSICLSSLADLSLSPRKKVRYFSYGSAVAGVMFIFGPFIGGKLSDPSVNPLFDSSFPLFIGAVLALLNGFFVLFGFQETLQGKSKERFDLIKGARNIRAALVTKSVRGLYLVYFFYLFSWNSIFLFIPAFAVQNFSLTNSKIGDLSAFLGLCWVLGTGGIHRITGFLSKIFKKKKTPNRACRAGFHKWGLGFSLTLFAFIIVFVSFATKLLVFIALLAVCTVIAGWVWPVCTGAISNAAPKQMQGKVMGISQSMLSLTMMVAAVLGGFFLQAHSIVPFVFSAIAMLAAVGTVFLFC